jgi:hypothetical protein
MAARILVSRNRSDGYLTISYLHIGRLRGAVAAGISWASICSCGDGLTNPDVEVAVVVQEEPDRFWFAGEDGTGGAKGDEAQDYLVGVLVDGSMKPK